MNTLGELNTFGNTSVVSTLETLYRSDVEGANIEMPLMAWAAVHDLGNPVTGTITITHTLPVNFANTIFSNANCVFTYGTGASANTVITRANNVITITGIHTPEDFFAGFVWMDFVRDKAGNGTYTTQIVNSQNASTAYTYPVVINLEDVPEFEPTTLADIPYNVYGNTLQDVNNVVTVLNSTQTGQIVDSENPNTDIYTVTWSTQDSPYCFQVASSNTANVTFTTGYANGNVQNGQFTVTGNRTSVNDFLLPGNMRVIKNAPVAATTDMNSCRIGIWEHSGSGSAPANDGVSYTELQSGNPFNSSSLYNMTFNNRPEQLIYGNVLNSQPFDEQAGYCWGGNFVISGFPNGFIRGFPGNESEILTVEFWFMAHSSNQTTQIMPGVGIYKNKIWIKDFAPAFGQYDGLPDALGTTTATSSYPKRIVGNTTIAALTWYHIAITRNELNEYRLYINGVNDSVYYSSGMNTTTVLVSRGWVNQAQNSVWRCGGTIPGINQQIGVVPNIRYNKWRARNLSGKITEVRMSTVLRYTSNFTPPTAPFMYDQYTRYLSAIGGFTNLASQGQSLSNSRRTMTWNIQAVSPETGVITTINQGYYPLTTTPVYDNVDINFETPTTGMYNMSYAGRDSANNPVFVYGFRADDPSYASIRLTKLDVATGAIQFGPTYSFSSNAVFQGTTYNFNQTGITVLSDQEQSNVGAAGGTATSVLRIAGVSGLTDQHNPGSGITLISTTLDRDQLTLSGNSTSYITGSTVARRLTSTNPTAYIGPPEVSVAYQTGGNTGSGSSWTYSTAQKAGNYANVVIRSTQTNTAYTATDYRISSQVQTMGLFNNYVVTTGFSVAVSGGDPGGPYALVTQVGGVGVLAARVLLPMPVPPSTTGTRMRSCVMSNTLNDGRWLMAGRQLNPGFGMTLYLQSGRFVPNTITLGTGINDIAMNIGAFAIVRGVSKNRAWLLYTQRAATGSSADTNYSRGLWYRSIDISDNQAITLGSPVQITDPATGNIYGMDMTAASTSIGAWTYIEAVIPQGGVPSNQVKPFMVGLRIPN